MSKNRKNKVIHEVIHVIHKKAACITGLHSKMTEPTFWQYVIKITKRGKKANKNEKAK